MAYLRRLWQYWQIHLVWKLILSYLIVIVVGMVTLTIAAEAVVPTAFNRHMMQMQTMMGDQGRSTEGGMKTLESDLFTNFRAAVTEALLIATVMAVFSAILVSVFVSRRIVIPIAQMTEASQRIAAGRYQDRVEPSSQDELGRLARSFNQMAATLEQTETMRRNLIADVTHELRTPLTSIKGYMEGLVDQILPATSETYQQVYREADRLQRLVNDLQELSRVEAGALALKHQPLSVETLVDRAISRLRPQFEEKAIHLHRDLAPDLPPVSGDEDRLNQVLLNLLGNALQYTPPQGTVRVKAEMDAGGQQVIISVIDTGAGISTENLPHLFTRFYRVDKSRSRVGGGSGIGLTIAKHLVEMHGGNIWAESKGLGQGSTFSFSLPAISD